MDLGKKVLSENYLQHMTVLEGYPHAAYHGAGVLEIDHIGPE